MYKSKPINSVCVIEHYPTVMYKVKSIYGNEAVDSVAKTCDPSMSMVNLSKDSQSQTRRLLRLQDKINQFCEDISLSHLIISDLKAEKIGTTKTQPELFPGRITSKKSSQIEDLVIQVSYKNIPYSILVAFSQLATKFKCFINFFTHGSAVNQLKKDKDMQKRHNAIKTLFHTLKLDLVDDRTSYDFGVSIIWKKIPEDTSSLGPCLSLNSKTSIYGESNITRYLTNLLNKTAPLQKDLDTMDKCTNALQFNTTPTSLYLTGLNKSITESDKFLAFGDQAGMADFYVWSMLRQKGTDLSRFGGVKKWMMLVEGSCPMVQMLGEI
jgi:hypothetical protein